MGFAKSRRVSIHEAGHVTVGLLLGQKPGFATIERKESHLSRVSYFDGDDLTQEGVRDLIVFLYAGAEAEKRVHFNDNRIKARAAADDELANEYLPYSGSTEEALRKVAADLVRTHWALVERIGAELLEYRTLDRGELNTIFNIYGGRETEGDLDEYRRRVA